MTPRGRPRRKSTIRMSRAEYDRMVHSVDLKSRLLRHEQRVNRMRLVGLASVMLRKHPQISTARLARALNCSVPEAVSVRHAFGVRTEMMVDRIMERYRRGQSLNKADLARDLALKPDELDWIAGKAANRIEREMNLEKKKK